jgi:hypothetical protein
VRSLESQITPISKRINNIWMEVLMIDSFLSDRIKHVSTGILLRNIKPANLEIKVSAITVCRVVFDEGL